jgi:hypothetical protein
MDALDDFSLSCSEDDSEYDVPFAAFAFCGGGGAEPGSFPFLPASGAPAAAAAPAPLPPPPPRRRRRGGGDADAGKSRGSYNCSKCGQPKRGHGAKGRPAGRDGAAAAARARALARPTSCAERGGARGSGADARGAFTLALTCPRALARACSVRAARRRAARPRGEGQAGAGAAPRGAAKAAGWVR